ncbi:MAG: hypothetical protein ACP5SB_04175 [Caldisericaceae bacterium]
MSKRIFASFIIFILVLSAVAVTRARIFDLRTGKPLQDNETISLDNLPYLEDGAYSGIYVGDSVDISGRTKDGMDVKITFPSGKVVVLPIVDSSSGFFKKTVTFIEEGTYKIEPIGKDFEVCYRIIPLKATFLKDIVGEKVGNDDYGKNFVDWNDAVAIEESNPSHSSPLFLLSFLAVDKNGTPIANLKGKKFTTDLYGIGAIPIDPNSPTIYGDIKVVYYDKFTFDKDGHFSYSSNGIKLNDGLMDNAMLFIDARNFVDSLLKLGSSDVCTIGDDYIQIKDYTAYPAIVKERGATKYVNAESVLASINTRLLGILGTAIEYYNDKTVLFVVFSGRR